MIYRHLIRARKIFYQKRTISCKRLPINQCTCPYSGFGNAARAMQNAVTIGDLNANKQLLEMGCLSCGRLVYGWPRNVNDREVIPALSKRMKCTKCGAGRNWCYATPDARQAISGAYPNY